MTARKASSSGASGSSLACPGARAKPIARPDASAITQALLPKPPRERPTASRLSRCAEDPLFGRSRGLLVGSDGGAVKESHPHFEATTLLRQFQKTFPDPPMTPAVEHLRSHPPWPQLSRYAAPLGAVLVPPDDRLDRPAQILGFGLAVRAARLDQRCKLIPLRVR